MSHLIVSPLLLLRFSLSVYSFAGVLSLCVSTFTTAASAQAAAANRIGQIARQSAQIFHGILIIRGRRTLKECIYERQRKNITRNCQSIKEWTNESIEQSINDFVVNSWIFSSSTLFFFLNVCSQCMYVCMCSASLSFTVSSGSHRQTDTDRETITKYIIRVEEEGIRE